MHIRILPNHKIHLEDHDNLKDFKVVCEGAKDSLSHVGEALSAAGAGIADAGHAWISEQWLRAQVGDAAWQAGLTKVVDYARSKGWVDENGHIRAHIEWK